MKKLLIMAAVTAQLSVTFSSWGTQFVAERRLTVLDGLVKPRTATNQGAADNRTRQWVPRVVMNVPERLLSEQRKLTYVSFERHSVLGEIGAYAFAYSGLTSIHLPASVEVICKHCFVGCKELACISFEP
jgi:hypothetical protein